MYAVKSLYGIWGLLLYYSYNIKVTYHESSNSNSYCTSRELSSSSKDSSSNSKERTNSSNRKSSSSCHIKFVKFKKGMIKLIKKNIK